MNATRSQERMFHCATIEGGKLAHAIEGRASFGRTQALCGAEPRGRKTWNRHEGGTTCDLCGQIVTKRMREDGWQMEVTP